VTFDSLSRDELEKQIVVLDRTKQWIDELVCVYQASLLEDEKMRAEFVPCTIQVLDSHVKDEGLRAYNC